MCLSVTVLAACKPSTDGTTETAESRSLVIYSGRNESLVGPLLDRFEARTGIRTEVRYGGTSELAATLLEEGENSPADVFLSQDAAALGALSKAGRFAALSEAVLARVPAVYRSHRGDWVGISGRARTVVFEPERIAAEDLPQSLESLADPVFKGRFGVAPTNGSFQAHMAVLAAAGGREALDRTLAGIVRNEPRRYPKNSAIVEAVIAGEIDFGLVNHYYLWRSKSENPAVTAQNFFMPLGEASSFVNVAGVGVLARSLEADDLVDFLLSEEAQEYFAKETYEYPLVPGISPSVDLPPLLELSTPNVDFGQVADLLEETLQAINASGLIR